MAAGRGRRLRVGVGGKVGLHALHEQQVRGDLEEEVLPRSEHPARICGPG